MKIGTKIMVTMIFAFLIAVPLISSQESLGVFKQNQCVELVQTCSDCTYVTFTRVNYPDGTLALSSASATQSGSVFNYTFCNTSQLGTYVVFGIGDAGGEDTVFAYDFEVTTTGGEFSTAKIIGYSLIFIVSLLIFIGLSAFALNIPSDYKRNEMTGYILETNNIKYLKYVLFGFAYLTLVFISYFVWMVTYSFLDMEFLSKIFQFIFYFLAVTTLPLFILFVYILITNWIKDSQVSDYLLRGLRIR